MSWFRKSKKPVEAKEAEPYVRPVHTYRVTLAQSDHMVTAHTWQVSAGCLLFYSNGRRTCHVGFPLHAVVSWGDG